MINAQLMAAMDVITGALLLALIAGLNIVSGALTLDLLFLFLFIALTTTSVCSYWIMINDQRLTISNLLIQKIIDYMRLCLFEIMETTHIDTYCCND